MPVLLDFEAPGLAEHWELASGGSATRAKCDPGWCLQVRPAVGSTIGSRAAPADWTGFGELRFRVRAAADTVIELHLPTGGDRGGYWRKVDVTGGSWQEVHLPLGWLRRREGPAPSWSAVRSVSFRFREATEVWIDDVAVVPGSPERTAEAVAAVTGGTVTRGRHAAVISLVPSMDADGLVARLDEVAAAVRADLPFLGAVTTPIPLVVYPDEPAYRAGVARIGAAFNATAAVPDADGFTLEGIATSSWDAEQGIGRPVYVHEFVHAMLEHTAGLPNAGDWLQEGLASWYQVERTPQPNLASGLRQRLADPVPLARLCDGERIGLRAYGEAWLVVGTLLEHPRWVGTLPTVFEAAARTGSTAMEGIGVDLAALDADRREWAARHFGW